MSWQTINLIGDLLADEGKHFVLGLLSGLLVFCLTWITFTALSHIAGNISRNGVSGRAARGILLSCLLLGLSASLASHWALDYWRVWYTTPISAPLQLDTSVWDAKQAEANK